MIMIPMIKFPNSNMKFPTYICHCQAGQMQERKIQHNSMHINPAKINLSIHVTLHVQVRIYSYSLQQHRIRQNFTSKQNTTFIILTQKFSHEVSYSIHKLNRLTIIYFTLEKNTHIRENRPNWMKRHNNLKQIFFPIEPSTFKHQILRF